MQWKLFFAVLAISSAVLGQDKPASEPAKTAETKPESVKVETKEESKPAETIWTRKFLTGDWDGHRKAFEDKGVVWELFYNQQFQQNIKGGLDTHNGHRLSGSYDMNLKFDFAKLFGKGAWTDDTGFYLRAAKGTWSDGINPNKIGAINNTNGDAGDDVVIFINKWWLWKKFWDKKIELRLGLLQTNKDLFDIGAYSNHEDKDFINRSSYRNSTIPHRNGTGIYLKVAPVDWFYTQAAVLDGQHEVGETGFNTAFHGEDKFNVYWESGLVWKAASEKGPMPGNLRVGLWYDSIPKLKFRDTLGGRLPRDSSAGNTGYYLGLDQMVWKEQSNEKDKQGLGVFARYGHADADVNRNNHYWSLGASYLGLIPDRDQDVVAFAASQTILSEQLRYATRPLADRETVYEMYYAYQVTPWCIVSPHMQFITNPGGDQDDRDAIVGGVRIRVIF